MINLPNDLLKIRKIGKRLMDDYLQLLQSIVQNLGKEWGVLFGMKIKNKQIVNSNISLWRLQTMRAW